MTFPACFIIQTTADPSNEHQVRAQGDARGESANSTMSIIGLRSLRVSVTRPGVAESYAYALTLTVTCSYSARGALVFRVLLHFRVLQHPLRTGVASTGDGRLRRHDPTCLDRVVGFHGRSGRGILDSRRSGSPLRSPN